MGSHHFLLLLAAFVVAAALVVAIDAESFSTDFDVSGNAQVLENGDQVQLTMDQSGGCSLQTKQQYLYGRFDMQIKVIPGHSAGTVTSFFLLSHRPTNDEIDFELLGNVTGEPYVLHTNVWTNGQGDREQQIYLWFDPRDDFHTYTIIWNPSNILWLVDEVPVRVYRNAQQQGIPYVNNQFLRTYAAVWNGEEWATRQGRVKVDWSQAPFTAYYRNYQADACVLYDGGSSCSENRGQWYDWILDETQAARLRSVRENYLVYDYCQDPYRFPQGFPAECSINM